MDDTALMAAVQTGNNMAFEILVNRYKKRAYYIALSLVGDHDEASDLSQEAFIRIYHARKRFRTDLSFFSWFYTILSNLAKNHLKKRSVRMDYAQIAKAEHNARLDGPTAPDLLIEADEDKQMIWEGIEKLSYDHREIIVLRHFEDMSYEDIAKLLNIPVGSVMSRLYYARRRLKEVIEKNHD